MRRRAQSSLPAESQVEADNSQTFSEDDLGHVIAAIDVKDHGTIGCAYFSAEKQRIYLLEDSRSGGRETIEACMSTSCFRYTALCKC